MHALGTLPKNPTHQFGGIRTCHLNHVLWECLAMPTWRLYYRPTLPHQKPWHTGIKFLEVSICWKGSISWRSPRCSIGLCTDGVAKPLCPQQSDHSMWPIMLSLPNLPRKMRNKFASIMTLSFLHPPGPSRSFRYRLPTTDQPDQTSYSFLQ